MRKKTRLYKDLTVIDRVLSRYLLRYKFKRLIYENDYYIKKNDSINSPQFKWWFDYHCGDTLLKIEVQKTAVAKVDKRIETELGTTLETLLNKELLSIKNEFNTVVFTFLYKLEELKELMFFDFNFIDNPKPSTILQLTKYNAVDFYKSPNAFISGKSGSGKTNYMIYLLREVLLNCTEKKYVFVADPKRSELARCGWNAQVKTAADPLKIYDMLETYYFKIYKAREKKPNKYPAFIFIDEYATFKSFFETKDKEDKAKLANIEKWIREISAMGRSRRVYLIIGNHRAVAEDIGTSTKFNIVNRIVFGDVDDIDYKLLFDKPKISRIPKGIGEGVIDVNGVLTSFKSALVDIQNY